MEKDVRLEAIPELETPRFLLRGMRLLDAQSLLVFMSDHDTMKYLTPHPVQGLEGMEKTIAKSLSQFKQQKEIPWVIIDKKTEEVIGMFRFHKLHFWHRKTELGAVLRNDFQQKGAMTEIFKEVLSFGFQTLGLNRIVGDIFADNIGSKRLLEKYGFHKDGTLRQTDFDGERYHDTIVYSLLHSEFCKIENK
jgi:ribosomal-protein-alanine N-acetyltransferase